MLRELAELTVLDEGDPQSFRARAYESAAQAIAGQGRISASSGKGASADSGYRQEHGGEGARTTRTGEGREAGGAPGEAPGDRRCPLAHPGHRPQGGAAAPRGARRAIDGRSARGWQLKRCAGSRASGSSPRRSSQHALARLDEQGPWTARPLRRAPARRRIVARLHEVPGVTHATFCGSLRRFAETIGDVDLVVAPDAAPVMEALVSMGSSTASRARRCQDEFVTRRGTQVDLRVVAEQQLGAAQLYFTGSKGHNIKLRQRALARGWTLNEYALSEIEGGKVVARRPRRRSTRRSVALDPAGPPRGRRRDRGRREGRAAAPERDPRRLPRAHDRLRRRPLDARGGRRRGEGARLSSAGDHRPRRGHALRRRPRRFPRPAGEDPRPPLEFADNAPPARRRAQHRQDGELDYDLEFRRRFDFTIASVHGHFDLDRAAQTNRVVTAMHDPT